MISGIWCVREFEKFFLNMFWSNVFGNAREGINMANNPDVYLLYEYMKKNAFTVRVKVTVSEPVDGTLLTEAAREAMTRFPYYSVKVGLDEGENYVLLPNDRPIAVLPEKDDRLLLGSEEVAGHLFAITWRDDNIWFNFAHCLCGGYGALPWVKTTMYQYLTKKYGEIIPPADLKAVGSPVNGIRKEDRRDSELRARGDYAENDGALFPEKEGPAYFRQNRG